jgi:hypothetical protein
MFGIPDVGQASNSPKGERMKRLIVVAVSVAALAGAGANAALAGEVKGPPWQPDNNNDTGALLVAHSACAASGLNDLDSTDPGQTVSIVQTAADSWKYYGYAKGAVGTEGLCRGFH